MTVKIINKGMLGLLDSVFHVQLDVTTIRTHWMVLCPTVKPLPKLLATFNALSLLQLHSVANRYFSYATQVLNIPFFSPKSGLKTAKCSSHGLSELAVLSPTRCLASQRPRDAPTTLLNQHRSWFQVGNLTRGSEKEGYKRIFTRFFPLHRRLFLFMGLAAQCNQNADEHNCAPSNINRNTGD